MLKIIRVKEASASVRYQNGVMVDVVITDPFIEGFSTKFTYLHIPIYLLDLVGDNNEEFNDIPVLLDDLNANYLRVESALKCVAEDNMKATYWRAYYKFLEFFNEFNYGYAVNTYVVQGDSYDHVFVNLRDILSVAPIGAREKLQNLYTAITRAKKSVTILV